jgi:hypothetical protein
VTRKEALDRAESEGETASAEIATNLLECRVPVWGWTRERVTSLRSSYRISVFRNPPEGEELWLNLSQAAAVVGVAPRTLRLAAERGDVKAIHPLPDGPWVFSRLDLSCSATLRLAELSSRSSKHPAEHDVAQQSLFASTT